MTKKILSINSLRITTLLPLYKPSTLSQFLTGEGKKPIRALSQNFLIDGNILRKLVQAAAPKEGDLVIEIGPGPGALTEALLESGANVLAIEKDRELARSLNRLQNGNLSIVADDFRNVCFQELLQGKGEVKVIANIPYHITGIILQKLLPIGNALIKSIHLMVQKEVALRCQAEIRSKDYSSFTLFIQYHAKAKLLFTVSPHCFYPPPKIDSAVLELILIPPAVKAPYLPLFQLIRAAFQQRRKMLRSSLRSFYRAESIEQALQKIALSPTARPQELSLEQFSALFFTLSAIEPKNCSSESDKEEEEPFFES